jgi:hypothetical protein
VRQHDTLGLSCRSRSVLERGQRRFSSATETAHHDTVEIFARRSSTESIVGRHHVGLPKLHNLGETENASRSFPLGQLIVEFLDEALRKFRISELPRPQHLWTHLINRILSIVNHPNETRTLIYHLCQRSQECRVGEYHADGRLVEGMLESFRAEGGVCCCQRVTHSSETVTE